MLEKHITFTIFYFFCNITEESLCRLVTLLVTLLLLLLFTITLLLLLILLSIFVDLTIQYNTIFWMIYFSFRHETNRFPPHFYADWILLDYHLPDSTCSEFYGWQNIPPHGCLSHLSFSIFHSSGHDKSRYR